MCLCNYTDASLVGSIAEDDTYALTPPHKSIRPFILGPCLYLLRALGCSFEDKRTGQGQGPIKRFNQTRAVNEGYPCRFNLTCPLTVNLEYLCEILYVGKVTLKGFIINPVMVTAEIMLFICNLGS